MVKIRFLMAYGAYRKGAVIEPPAMLRGRLLSVRLLGRPVCEVVEEAKPEPPKEPETEPDPDPEPEPAPNRKRKRSS